MGKNVFNLALVRIEGILRYVIPQLSAPVIRLEFPTGDFQRAISYWRRTLVQDAAEHTHRLILPV